MLLCDERRAPPPMTPEDDLCWGSQDDLRPPWCVGWRCCCAADADLNEPTSTENRRPTAGRGFGLLYGRDGRFAPLSLAGPQGGRADIDGTLAEKQASWRP